MSNPRDDQIRAAERESDLLIERIKEQSGPDARVLSAPWGEVTNAWREGLQTHLQARTLRFCSHAMSPSVVIYAPWLPGLLLCPACHHTANISAGIGEVEDNTCDGCGDYRPGQITNLTIQLGAVVLIGGLCPECRNLEQRTAEAAASG
jgi:hypothetical protein